ncbi:MAG: alpha/beta fold hydrolase [Rhizobiales bacterium]|nr:alpha/beta fold hydrolase [Hyphomicrobiales bacterium]
MFKSIFVFLISTLSKIAPALGAKIAVELFSRPKRFDRTLEEKALFKDAKQIKFSSGRIANQWSNNFDAKQPIALMIHGWESRGTTFHKLIRSLVAKNYRVITWNAPAHGASPGNKTNLLEMTFALAEDLKQEYITPDAIVGHSMGGAIIGLLSKLMSLPKSVTIISCPTDITGIFKRYFDLIKVSKRSQTLILEHINNLSQYNIDDMSLVNLTIYKQSSVLIIHDKNDKEIPYSDFLALKNKWQGGEFLSTEGLGHRRILRDDALVEKITNHILTLYK